MPFNNDWSSAVPVDHTKFKSAPSAIRDIRIDLEDRLADILYGFTAGETYVGFKYGRFITLGTGAPSAPSGTGAATAMDVYARANGTNPAVELWCIGSGSAAEIQLTHKGKIPLDKSARLANNAYLIARNYADNANVNILKVNTANAIEIASHITAPDTSPSAALQLAPKGYVDAEIAAIPAQVGFGAWASKNTGTNYEATTDGIVLAYTGLNSLAGSIPCYIYGYSDSTATPTTLRQKQHDDSPFGEKTTCIMFPVRKGDYWRVEISSTYNGVTIFWLPLGS